MKSYSIAICDDKKNELDNIRAILSEIAVEMNIQAEFYTYDNSGEIIEVVKNTPIMFDIFFLDMYIDEKIGLDIARTIREKNKNCVIIFITGFIDKMADCFTFRASSYLLKPVSREEFSEAFRTALSHLGGDENFNVDAKGVASAIPYKDICYFESYLKNIKLFLVNQKEPVIFTHKLNELDLPVEYFYRCHNSFIVNFTNVQMMDKSTHEFIMSNGARIQISRPYYAKMSADFMKFHSVTRR